MNRGFKWLFVVGGILIAVLIIASLFGGGYWGMMGGYRGWGGSGYWGMGPGMMGWSYPWMWGNFGGGWIGPLVAIIFFGLIIAAVIALIRFVIPRSRIQSTSTGTDYALDILKNRYAKGEINKEEYEQKRKDLV